jgi:hypothetical protein
MLYMLLPVAEYLAPTRRTIYHQLLPITTLTRGALIDLLFLGVLAGIGFVVIDHVAPRYRQLLWLPVLVVTSWVVARDISVSMGGIMARMHMLQLTPYVPLAVLLAATGLMFFAPRIYSYCIRGTAVLLAAGGIALIALILPQLTIASFSRLPREQADFIRATEEQWQPGKLRVVWILFDELSYRQALERPQTGIQLPAFASLAAQSITFSHLEPVGSETEQVIPSLLLGQQVADEKGAMDGNLLVRFALDSPWQRFDQNETVFAEAKRQGWKTGVAGWYNPYCRILNAVLDRCYWTYHPSMMGVLFSRLSSDHSTWENARDGLPLAARLAALGHKEISSQGTRDDYRNLLLQGKDLVQDTNTRLAFIHMPVPHPPGIFRNPNVAGNQAFDYLGNLILADRALGQFLQLLAKSPAAADTVLIVSSDHSWRVSRWRASPGWTKAEERATDGGVFDRRPVLMVRFPGQNKPQQIDRPESAMIVHNLLLDLIQGKVHSPEEWIAKLPVTTPAENEAAQNRAD